MHFKSQISSATVHSITARSIWNVRIFDDFIIIKSKNMIILKCFQPKIMSYNLLLEHPFRNKHYTNFIDLFDIVNKQLVREKVFI